MLRAGDDRGGAKLIGDSSADRRPDQVLRDGLRTLAGNGSGRGLRRAEHSRLCGLEPVTRVDRCRLHRRPQCGSARIPGRSDLLVRGDPRSTRHGCSRPIPGLAGQFEGGAAAADLAGAIWTSKIRYLGVGAMLVGGVWALFSMRGSLWSGLARRFRQRE